MIATTFKNRYIETTDMNLSTQTEAPESRGQRQQLPPPIRPLPTGAAGAALPFSHSD